jgi:hypothetical protein
MHDSPGARRTANVAAADAFDRGLAWQTVDTAFDVRMRILRGDLPEDEEPF